MAYPTYTTPRSIAGAVTPTYLVSALASGYSAGQTITVGNTFGWYEVSSSGTATTNPLGTSGVFTLVVDYGSATEEKILCASGSIPIDVNVPIFVWTDGTYNGRGWDGTTSVAHATGSGTNPNVFLVRTAVDDLQFNTSAATLTNNLATLSGQYAVTSGIVTAQSGYISTISGKQATDEANIASLSGSLATLSGQYLTTSGIVTTATGNIATLTSNLATLSGQYVVTSGSLTTLSGQFVTLSGAYATTSGNLNTTNANVTTLSGQFVTLSGQYNTTSGIVTSHTSSIALISGNLNTLSGQYNTTSGIVTTATGNISLLSGSLATLSGQFVTLSGAYNTTSGIVTSNTNSIALISGNLNTVSGVAYAALPGSGGTISGNLVIASGLTVTGTSTHIGNSTFSGTLTVASAIINPILQGAYEVVSYSGSTVLSGTATPAMLNAANSSFYFYNTAPSGSYTVAITGAPTVSGRSATFALLVNNGSTAYLPSNVTINGNQAGASSSALPLQGATNNNITTFYQGGTAWSSADASTLDSYTFTVICTSATPTWTLLAGLTKF